MSNNFFIKGKRITSPTIGNKLVSFEMSVKQHFNSYFTEVLITVLIPRETWEIFPEKDNVWLSIDGKLISEKTSYNFKVYKMLCSSLTTFSPNLYESLGGECYFEGLVVLKQNKSLDKEGCFAEKIYCTIYDSTDFDNNKYYQNFVGIALRKKASRMREERLKKGDKIFVVAKLMPPTNHTEKNFRNFFSIRDFKIVQ